MPAIRDYSWNYTAVATGTTLSLPMPAYQTNDLLLAIITADTGTATWTLAGWTELFRQTNTCQQVALWKIAGSSEADPTFTCSVAESYNGVLMSIRDINTAAPFGATPLFATAAQAAAAKFAMPSLTTTVSNALLIYSASNSGLGVPSIIEGGVTGIIGADGLAESMGAGWTFAPVSGVAYAGPTCSNVASGAGINSAIQIAPPSGGAQVIPAYCVQDNSIYIDPINGTTAYNGNTALAATADTNFGTTLGGITAQDATVAAAADVGINSFHSCGRLTTATGTKTMCGADLVLAVANRPNVSGKNVLVHFGPSTEGQHQRYSSAVSGRGMWFGMRSGAATDFKIWQAHGVDSPWRTQRHVPLVVNDLNVNGVKASAGTLNPASVFSFGFWISGTGVTTTIADIASLWVLDTVVVGGGNAAEPLGIPGIVSAHAAGHERRSAIQQGANQMLLVGPVQFGNGAAPLNLDLNATAIEFPRIYNQTSGEVTYCSAPNVAGITYYASAVNTVRHRNSVVSSPSPFHWRVHASSSASATYDFAGLSIIGAGDVVLRDVTTFASMSFTTCTLVTQNNASIDKCTFTGSPLLSGNPGKLSNNSFKSGGAGHAIEITTPGTYTFLANAFTGFGADATTNAAVYNNSGGVVTLNVTNGGVVPTVRNGTGASTTVNAPKTLTITNLKPGSDVVVKQAGTTAVIAQVDANSTTTWAYSYQTQQSVDIDVYLPGYAPYNSIRSYPLGATDASIPVSQQLDRNYL